MKEGKVGVEMATSPPLKKRNSKRNSKRNKKSHPQDDSCEAVTPGISSDGEGAFDGVVSHHKKRKRTTEDQMDTKDTTTADTVDGACSGSTSEVQLSPAPCEGTEIKVYKCEGIIDYSQSFKDFGALHLDRRLLKVLTDVLRLENPTHVQAQVLPLALGGRDLVVEGRTGSGKTLAYVLPLLQRLLQLHAQQQQTASAALPPLSGIVIVPTKELCIQVYEVLTTMLKYTSDIVTVSHTAVQGSTGVSSRGVLVEVSPTIMVGTPTGLLQYLEKLRPQHHGVDLQLSVQVLVVDEADLLFAFGFEKDTRRLLQQLPSTAARHYQTILVSATQNHELAQLQSLMLHKPLIVRIEEMEGTGGPGSAGSIGEFYFQVPTDTEKWLVAYAFLRLGLVPLKCLVFCKDVSNVYALRLFLDRFGIASGVLSPTLPVAAREQQIQAFNQGLIDILITNDGQGELADDDGGNTTHTATHSVTSSAEHQQQSSTKRLRETAQKAKDAEFAGHRGLDLHNVACVFNFDAPCSLKSYIHRCTLLRDITSLLLLQIITEQGRTARSSGKVKNVIGSAFAFRFERGCRIGRTGRGGAGGVAVTLIDSSQEQQHLLLQQLLTLRRTPGTSGGSTLTPLSLQLQDVECFRYRVEDVKRGLTKRVIAAAVARDLQQQLLNSRKLKEFFERNPRDKEVLKRACKQLKEINVSKGHLGHLPDYLLSQTQPTQMTAVQLAIQQQKVAEGGNKGSQGSRRRAVADPLKSFKAAVVREASTGKRRRANRPRITREGQLAKMPRHADEVPPEALPAISGRKLWKLRHNKRVGVKEPKGNFLRKRSIQRLHKK